MWKFLLCVLFMDYASSEKILIIGAGPSGIAAASRLLDHNITDFRILEAENRTGGRIHSFYLGSAIVDLGAQYVHGEEGNLAYQLAKNYLKPGNELNCSWLYYSGVKRTDDDNLLNILWELREETYEYGGLNVSLGDAFLIRYNSAVLNKYKNDTKMLAYCNDFIRFAECSFIASEGSFTWFEPTASSSFQDCVGGNTLSWDGLGYKTILDILLKNFPNKTGYDITDQISLGKTVSKIILNGSLVTLKCEDGSEYISEHVIFSPSLGVLKHDHRKMFQPGLSSDKINAIENFGFDGVMKIIFEFPNNWWGDEKHFLFVWNDDEKKNLIKDIPYGPIKDGDHWLSWFHVLGIAPNNPNVLIAWIVGPMVADTEKLTSEEMKNGTIYAIRKFLGNDFNVTEPLTVIHSKWCTNPNFRGTYSFETLEQRTKNISSPQKTLLQPITDGDGIPRILFAGEATSPTRYGTVDGAIGTGYRESDRLANIIKSQ